MQMAVQSINGLSNPVITRGLIQLWIEFMYRFWQMFRHGFEPVRFVFVPSWTIPSSQRGPTQPSIRFAGKTGLVKTKLVLT
jgi:hypothetical protein